MERLRGSRRADELLGGDAAERILGLAGDDTIDAGAGDDIVSGGAGGDLLFGEDGADLLSGGPGADTLTAGAGNDDLSGGPGLDIAAFAGPRARYAITLAEDGTATVRDYAAEGDGTDSLRAIERLQFADGALDLGALPATHAPVVLSQVAEGQGGGFAILGGRDARPAGDVNGDGLGDLLMTGADGAAFVVFGKTDTTPLDLADVAAGLGGGFRVGGSGGAFAVPDLNGDGRAEILANGGPDGPVLVFGK
jgi:Ca2+-binding RTX toxin-like protein